MIQRTFFKKALQAVQKETMRHIVLVVYIAIIAGFFVHTYWLQTLSLQEVMSSVTETFVEAKEDLTVQLQKRKKKPEAIVAKGIYLTAYSAGSERKMNAMIDLINATELNTVIIDIKDYSGKVLYDSDVPLVNELGLEDDRIGDVKALIQKLHDNNIYVIARQTVFQDPILARKKQEWAIHNTYGGLWYDHKGLAWVDPTHTGIWDYNVQIAREAIALGFDEINFDYVRFPSDGNLKALKYTNGDRERHEVMHEFYSYLSDQLSDEPAWISLDLFGFVMERHDGMSIGQRLEDSVNEVDYIAPMMYPSHYPPGHLGLANPAANPGIVIDNGMKKGVPYFEGTRAQVRPWLQAFHLGAKYNAAEIRAQIDNVEKYPNAGWLLWNAANRYSTAGLKLASEE